MKGRVILKLWLKTYMTQPKENSRYGLVQKLACRIVANLTTFSKHVEDLIMTILNELFSGILSKQLIYHDLIVCRVGLYPL